MAVVVGGKYDWGTEHLLLLLLLLVFVIVIIVLVCSIVGWLIVCWVVAVGGSSGRWEI